MRSVFARVAPLLLASLTACVAPTSGFVRVGTEGPKVFVEGLSPCRPHADGGVVTLDPAKPITILVHGCNSSAGRFRTLSGVFEAHGQQVACFNYDDRDWLDSVSHRLGEVLELLEEKLEPGQITIFGHSQGGLVARRALIRDRNDPVRTTPGFSYRLVTVSTPFGGIDSSADCGRVWIHLLSLSVTVGVCQAIAGNKWTEIYPWADFMEHPGVLLDEVSSHLKIVTDERGECRTFDEAGRCAQDDFVFSAAEQHGKAVDADDRVVEVTLKAGHSAVVGEEGRPPMQLIVVLQQQNVLAETPPDRRLEMAALIHSLYAR